MPGPVTVSELTLSGQKFTYLVPDSYSNFWRVISQFNWILEANTTSCLPSRGTTECRLRPGQEWTLTIQPRPLTAMPRCTSFRECPGHICKPGSLLLQMQYPLPGTVFLHFSVWGNAYSSCYSLQMTIFPLSVNHSCKQQKNIPHLSEAVTTPRIISPIHASILALATLYFFKNPFT